MSFFKFDELIYSQFCFNFLYLETGSGKLMWYSNLNEIANEKGKK